ncbi:hypothetical protein Nmel_005561 [Mimus melanotis]
MNCPVSPKALSKRLAAIASPVKQLIGTWNPLSNTEAYVTVFRCWSGAGCDTSKGDQLLILSSLHVLQRPNMGTEMGDNCAICQDTWDDMASALPCGHLFCRGCILQWAQTNPSCPLCRRAIETLRFSDDAGDYLEIVITAPEQLPAAMSQAGRAPGGQDENNPHSPVLPHPSPQETPARAVGGVLPEIWAQLFRQRRELLDPVRTWLNQSVEAIQRDEWWMARSTQSAILHALCVYGPDQEMMIQSLQDVLEEHTVPLVQDTIDIIVRHCSSEAQRLLRSHAAADEDDSPEASSSSSSSSSIFSIFSMFSGFSSPNSPNNPNSSSPNNPNSSSPNSLSSPSPNSPSSSFSSSWTWVLASSPEVSVEEEEEAATTEAIPARGQSHPLAVPVSPEQDQPQEEAGPSVQSTSPRPSGLTQGRCSSPGQPQRSLKRKAPDRLGLKGLDVMALPREADERPGLSPGNHGKVSGAGITDRAKDM